jgi:hypothetical protein
VIGNKILFFASRRDRTSNNIAVYSTTGTKLNNIPVAIVLKGEGGLSINEATLTVLSALTSPIVGTG